MTTKRRMIIMLVLTIVVCGSSSITFDWTFLDKTRSVDILRIFAMGMMVGLLISSVAAFLREKRNAS